MASTCESCGAGVLVAPTVYGRTMMLDAAPSPRGTIRLEQDGRARVLGDGQAEQARGLGESLYMIHTRSCRHSTEGRS